MAKYTADAATALFVVHVEKQCSSYIYHMINHYLKEMKAKSSEGKHENLEPEQEIVMNPRCKKK
jgi:hypothetical protein